MDVIKATARAAVKQPSILVTAGILMLAAAVINVFVPAMAIITGIVSISGANVFDSLLSILQMLLDPGIVPTLLIALAVLSLLAAIAAGLLLPGYISAVDSGLSSGAGKRGLFADGIKRNFFRFFLMTLKTALLTVLAVVFLIISAIPAIVVTRAALTVKPDLMIAALFIDFVTIGAVFFSTAFIKAYIYMWYIAASKGESRPFKAGKAVVDREFWNLAFGLAGFDIVFAAVIYLIYLSESQIFRYVTGWLFTTTFFTVLPVYLVRIYRRGSRE